MFIIINNIKILFYYNNFNDNFFLFFLFLFFINFLLIIIIYLFFIKKIEIYKILILQKINIIKFIPLKNKIIRISKISKFNSLFKNFLNIYKKKYEFIYNIKLIKYFDYFRNLLINEKKNLFLILKKLKYIYSKLEVLEKKIRILLKDINNDLKIDLLQRNFIIFHKKIFVLLNKKLLKLKNKRNNFNFFKKKRIIFLKKSINNFFINFNIFLLIGDFKKNNKIIFNLIKYLIFYSKILNQI